MSMSIGVVGNSYPVPATKAQGAEEYALMPIESAVTAASTEAKIVPESALVRLSGPMNFPAGLSVVEAMARARTAGAYGLATMAAPVEPLRSVAEPAPIQEVSGLGFIPGDVFTSKDPGAIADYLRGEVAEGRTAARRERDMSEEVGQEVRLVFDPNTGREIALTRDDPGFDAVRGARAMFAGMGYDLRKMGFDPTDFRDLLRI